MLVGTVGSDTVFGEPVTSEETYSVTSAIKDGSRKLYDIEVLGERDGRYSRASKILWGADRVLGTSNCWVEEIITEKAMPMGMGEASITTSRFGPLVRSDGSPGGLEIRLGADQNPVLTTAIVDSVSVPAGRFRRCLELVTAVTHETYGGTWRTHSYYAPNVGLIKEIQHTPKGAISYLLELTSYRVGGKK